MTAIVHLIEYQKDKKIFHLFCQRCESQFQEELPVTMRPQNITCPECLTEGFVVGHARRRKD